MEMAAQVPGASLMDGRSMHSLQRGLSLQVLFPGALRLDPERLTRSLRRYHRSMREALLALDRDLAGSGSPVGMVGWGLHAVSLLGIEAPVRPATFELCVGPARYAEEIKDRARSHQSHVLLTYGGSDSSPLEQYVALSAVAGVLAEEGAILALNQRAHTSIPIETLARGNGVGDSLELLRALPVPALYAGLVEVPSLPNRGIWLRTYGNPALGMPDLATHRDGPGSWTSVFQLFSHISSYLLASGAELGESHTMQVGAGAFVKFRAAAPGEPFSEPGEQLLVTESITSSQSNRLR